MREDILSSSVYFGNENHTFSIKSGGGMSAVINAPIGPGKTDINTKAVTLLFYLRSTREVEICHSWIEFCAPFIIQV